MSAEPKPVTNTGTWMQWENQIINGVFPLRRCLAGSAHSAVFLTEYKAKNLSDVAIKFVPTDALQAEAQLAQWRTAAKHSHPHLVRLFAVGRCQREGREFLFVVMEYAEQTLAQVLSQRALSADEVQEMLPPTLGALTFLHGNRLVHGRLKPSNFLVVNDQLKLASDTVRPIGNSSRGTARASSYDPPELKVHGMSPAGDIWSLGMTLVEALTQRTPARSDERGAMASLPAGLPASLMDTVRRCLSLTPANRPGAIELEARYKPASQTHSISAPQPGSHEARREPIPPKNFPKRHALLLAVATALLISLAVWVGLHSSGAPQAHLRQSAVPAPALAVPARVTPASVAPSIIAKPAQSSSEPLVPVSLPPDQPFHPSAATSLSVLHEVSPDIPRAIRDKIQGRVHVAMRVLVDPSGNVVGALMENPGPSRYFARLAGDAAREWQFAPADSQGARVWLLRFEFSRDGVTARAAAVQ